MKIYLGGMLGYIVYIGMGIPLILVNYMLGYDIQALYVIGWIVTFIHAFTYIFINKLFYDLFELTVVLCYYIASIILYVLIVYITYKAIIYGRYSSINYN